MVCEDYICTLRYHGIVSLSFILSLSHPLHLSRSPPPPPVSSNLDVVVGLSSSPSSPSTPALPEFLSQLQVQGSLAEGEGQRSADGASLVDQCSDLYSRARHKDGVSYTLSISIVLQCMIVMPACYMLILHCCSV